MPVVDVKITAGRSADQKEKIIAGITKVLVDTLNIKPEQVTVLIYELPKEHWGIQGKPLTKVNL